MNNPQKSNARILIVDDEPAIRNLLRSILCDDYDCTTADSAEAALSYIENETFDLVLSDINMGEMSGIELVSRVVALSTDTVVMVISGNDTIDSPIAAIRSGAFDYIRKPFDIDQVGIAVDRAITHRRLLVSKRRHENELEELVAERTERLNYLAYHDSLTDLPNRAYFDENLNRTLARRSSGSTTAVLLVAPDRFNNFRDTLGHSLGGRLLSGVAKRLDSLKEKGAVVARFEGDEFALMLPGVGPEELDAFAKNGFGIFDAPFTVGEYEIFVTVSIGISISPDDGNDAQTLLKNAGAALSLARKRGGNNYQFYTADLQEKALKRLALENDLRRALERDEFELFYQPKIEINTRQIVGMEALIRWNHPELGLVPPMDFIPAAEETGLILPMGEWIMKTACTQAKLWHDQGHKLRIAVNLSTCQFQQGDLVEKILGIVSNSEFDPAFLNLEVTESSIMNNAEAAVKSLTELRDNGIKISIDDFGTGYSSLGYLKHLPIDVLKIDKSFVSDMTDDPDDAALVMAIISLGHTLRLLVVAEGVETEEQLRFLHTLRCDEWQGYLFSRPVAAEAFEKLLVKHMGSFAV